MFKKIFKNYVYPIATLAGSIIGVGFLSLPYIALKVGIFVMLFYFAALTVLVVFIHVIFGQISLKTPDYKRWPGFVGFHLGRLPKTIVLISTTLGSLGVLLVYLIVGGQFLTAICGSLFGGDATTYVFLYFIAASVFVYFGVKAISKVDFLALALLLVILCIIFIEGFSHMRLSNIFIEAASKASLKNPNIFLPYGAVIFSLWGVGLIPEIEEMVVKNKKSLKNIIIIGTLIPAAVYLLFIFLILAISGNQTTESALLGLKAFLGKPVMSVAYLIGVITTFIAFIAQGLLLKKVFMYDMGIKESFAWVLTVFPPLLLFLLGFNSFIPLISFIGGALLSIDGILILLMYKKIGGKKIIVYPLAIFFILAMAYEVIYFIH